MTFRKRFLTALTAAALSVSSVPAVLNAPVTAATSNTIYDDFDIVPYYMFETDSSTEAQEKLERAFRSATKKEVGSITFSDLQKVTSLNLSNMGLEGIPEAIEYMVRLRTLNLSNNLLRSSDLNSVDLSGCISLSNVDLSKNYLTSVPSWFVALDIPTKNISGNLIGTSGQRSITATPSVYYYMSGETLNENALKNKILASVKLSDGSKLPVFFYDPEYPTYNALDPDDTDHIDDYDLFIDDWDLSKYVDNNHIVKDVSAPASVDVTVTLFSSSSKNTNCTATIKIYFLDGTSPSSTKVRLQTLISECEGYKKESYTATTWNNFSVALTTAKTIYAYANADADMLKNALDGLEKARKELIGGVDSSTKKVLNDLVTAAKNFKEEDYSVASWAKFAAAVAELKDAAADTDASVTRANAAIKAYQDAIAGLSTTSLSVPSVIPKSEFESIYGENKILARTGTTRDGYKYTWEFNGRDIVAPKDFKPEIKYQSTNEEKIRLEVGSASDYRLFSFVETGVFPGMAKITLDVSEKYQNGTYRLYKWNNSKSEFLNDVTVVNGLVEVKINEGGDYFISSVLQNFEIISNNFDIDHTKLTISGAFKKKFTVNEFRNSIQNGEAVMVLNADGTVADGGKYISTGMTARAANSDVSYTIVVPGDIDGDGNITSLDAVYILRAITGDIELDTYSQKLAGDVDGDGYVTALDAVRILRYNIGMDDDT